MSLKPQKSEHHYWWIAGFVIVGIAGVILTALQTYSTDQKEQALQITIGGARDDARSARDESKAAGDEMDKMRVDLAIESARREQAQKDMALLVQKAGVETRTGVAEDFRKSPIKIDVAPIKEPFKVTGNLLQAATGDHPPYETKFILTVNQMVTPIRLLVHCESEILQANGSVAGAGVQLSGGWGGRFSPNQFGIGISSPAWIPTTPLIVTVKSNQKPLGTCTFTQQ